MFAQDLRSSHCLQTIDAAEQCAPEDARPGVLLFDSTHCQLVTVAHRPLAWAISSVSATLSAHAEPLVTSLHNSLFDVVSGRPVVSLWSIYFQ